MTLSLKTQMEQAAGRGAIQDAVNLELLNSGFTKLQKRFPGALSLPNLYQLDGEWVVALSVQAVDGTKMRMQDKFLGFPSDFLIAQIMLVV